MAQNGDFTNGQEAFSDDGKLMFSADSVPQKPKWHQDTSILTGLGLTVVWIIAVADFALTTGWWDERYSLTPTEFMSVVAGLLSPMAFVWIAVAYFSVQRNYAAQAKELSRYISGFMHPDTKNKLYIKSLLDDLREQTQELNAVQSLLQKSTLNAGETLNDRVTELTKIAAGLEQSIENSVQKIRTQTEELHSSANLIDDRTAHNATMLRNGMGEIQLVSKQTEDALTAITTALTDSIASLKSTGDELTDRTMNLSAELREQNTLMSNAADNACTLLTRQTAMAAAALTEQAEKIVSAGNDVFSTLNAQTADIKKDIRAQIDLITASGDEARDNMSAITAGLEEQTRFLQTASQEARENAEKMQAGLERRIETLEEIFTRQNSLISDKDALLMQNSEKLQETFKEQNIVLDQEAEKIVARFKTIETTLDTYINEINAAATTAVERITSVSDSLNGKAGQISDAGSQVCTAIATVDEEIGAHTELLSETADRLKSDTQAATEALNVHTQSMASTLDDVSAKLVDLHDAIDAGINDVNALIASTETKSDSVCQKLAKQAGELSDLSGALVSQALVTETSLTQQQKYIANASTKLEEHKASLKEQADDLTSIATLLDTRSAETVANLSKLMEDTLRQADKAAEQIMQISTVLQNNLTAFDQSTQRAVSAGTTLRDELSSHKSALDDSVEKVTLYAEKFSAEVTRKTTQMDMSSELIQSRSEKAVALLEEQFKKLNDDAHDMIENTERAAATLSDESEKVQTLFDRQNTTLSDVSDKLLEQSSQTATLLREQSEQADKDLERLISRIHLIEEGLSVQTKELSSASEMTVSQLETVGAALTRQSENLMALTDAAKAKISETDGLISETAQKLSAGIQDACDLSIEAVAALEAKHGEFKTSANELVQRISLLQDEIGEQTDGLQKQTAKSTQQAIMIRDSMQRHIIDLGDVANLVATQSRMGEASLGNQIAYLKEAAEDVMTHIRNINEAVRKNTNDLLTASSRIGFELDAMGENLRRRNEEASKAAEDSLNRSQTAAQFLEEKARLLSDTTEKVITGLNTAGGEFSAQANMIEAAGEIARDQIELTGDTFLVQSHQLTRISEESQKAVKNLGVVLRERAADFNKTAQEADSRVHALETTVQQIGKEFEEMSNKGVIQIDLAGQRLRSMISEVAGNSERIAVEVRKSGEQFVDQSDLLSIAADDTLKKLQELRALMRDNAKEIQESGEKISAQSIKLGGAFNRQVQALISASRSAEEYITALDKRKEEADTERFMRETAVIIEKLQSLGVDITRLFTPNVEEDLWKRYYSGDHGAFIRYLSRAIDKHQVKKMTDMFTENAEFRDSVSRYIAEFDGILARAQENERADVMVGLLLGSDAGRLYLVLSRVFNKEA